MNFNKDTKIIILLIYAILMFSTILNQVSLLLFFVLFVILPIGIYLFVKYIFPKDNKKR